VISERQIEDLLTRCEQRLGLRLEKLRNNLLHHRETETHIWELVVLFVVSQCFEKVQHEPGKSMPDIVVKRFWATELSFEATLVSSSAEKQSNQAREFRSWVYRKINAVTKLNGGNLDLIPIHNESDAYIPAEHQWPSLLKDRSWGTFLHQITDSGQANWVCPNGNFVVAFKVRENGFVVGGSDVYRYKYSGDIESHPIYKCIRRKAKQIRNWNQKLTSKPVVLVVGINDSGMEFFDNPANPEGAPKHAIYSALLYPDRLNVIDRYNILHLSAVVHEGQWQSNLKSHRVSGSSKISAVVLVQIENQYQFDGRYKRVAKATLYQNYHADNKLSEIQLQQIQEIDFNLIEYGPGWEDWEGHERSTIAERNLERGGGFKLTSYRDQGFEIELPAIDVLKVLAGAKTAQDVFKDYRSEPTPLSMFKKAFESGMPIIESEIVPREGLDRSETMMRICFGEPQQPTVASVKGSK